MSELGERLSKLRRDKGMTQEELASHLQVTRQTVSSYENGKVSRILPCSISCPRLSKRKYLS